MGVPAGTETGLAEALTNLTAWSPVTGNSCLAFTARLAVPVSITEVTLRTKLLLEEIGE